MWRLPRRLAHEEGAELVDHLGELRARLFVCLIAVSAGFVAGYVVHARLVELLLAPLPGDRKLVTFGVAEPFLTSMQVSLAAGFAIALPIVLWQIWSFLAPAVQPHLQRAIAGCVAFATLLFVGGVAFSYRVALPAALKFLTTYDHSIYDIQIRARDYVSFAVAVLVAVGIVFELPAVIVTLVRLGIVSSKTLRRKRRLGYVVVAALAVALPGVDPVTTVFEMVPLLVLFEASIWLSVAVERRARSRRVAELAV
jgi:sec-independent protein translocase protein TatC